MKIVKLLTGRLQLQIRRIIFFKYEHKVFGPEGETLLHKITGLQNQEVNLEACPLIIQTLGEECTELNHGACFGLLIRLFTCKRRNMVFVVSDLYTVSCLQNADT